jgi:hypothetical protein
VRSGITCLSKAVSNRRTNWGTVVNSHLRQKMATGATVFRTSIHLGKNFSSLGVEFRLRFPDNNSKLLCQWDVR